MMIRDIERPVAPRVRFGRKADDPLRRTAAELNDYLGRLSEAVRSTKQQIADSVDDSIEAREKSSRRFKMHGGAEAGELSVNLNEEQSAALELLKEARTLAADAETPRLSIPDRDAMQARFQDIFRELGENRAAALLSLSGGGESDGAGSLFSLATPKEARTAYEGVEGFITKIFQIGARDAEDGEYAAVPEHEMAIRASERLRDFLINEGPANAFGRFREINRSNVLGLLK